MQTEFRSCRLVSDSSVVCLSLLTVFAWIMLTVSGCRTTPVTQRKQLLLTSEAKENKIGLVAYEKVLSEETLSQSQQQIDMVRRVGNRIARAANRPDFDWEFNLIESEAQNAFCLPGGKVAVYSGMLPVCESEAGLAVVMAHEVAHAIARHGGERMTHDTVQNLGKSAVGYLLKNQQENKQRIVLTAYGAASEYGAILPYSRKHELEADQIGIMLMAKAGYDPSEAPIFWERFATIKGGQAPMEFLSTHPSDGRRSIALRGLLPEALQVYNDADQQYGLGESVELAAGSSSDGI
jgi:metalloendopeptidase OMA1, mitochondrial